MPFSALALSLAVAFGVTSATYADTIPVEKVPVSLDDRDTFLPDVTKDPTDKDLPVYARRFCTPFQDSEDARKDKEPFVICGENSDAALAKITSITGVDISTLDRRAKGLHLNDPFVGYTIFSRKPKADDPWYGLNNLSLRHSSPGFIWESQTLCALLIQDNRKVLRRCKLTHQKLAEPLLVGIDAYERAKSKSVEFKFNKKKYRISGERMGGEAFVAEEDDVRAQNRSGWVGFGTQGSFFRDELYANWVFKIERVGVKKDGIPGPTELSGDALTPHLIARYGFYQGAYFRIHPEYVARFFQLSECDGK